MKVGSLVELVKTLPVTTLMFAMMKSIDLPQKGVPYEVKEIFLHKFPGGETCTAIELCELNGIYNMTIFRELQSPEEGIEVIKSSVPEELAVAV